MNRSLVIALNILRQIRNDRRTAAMTVITPILVMVLFGYAFAGDPKGLPMYVANQDIGTVVLNSTEGQIALTPRLGSAMVNAIDKDTFTVYAASDQDQARQRVLDGQAWGALYIPRNFTRDMVIKALAATNQAVIPYGGTPHHLNLTVLRQLPTSDAYMVAYVDNSNTQVGALILRKIQEAVATMLALSPANVTIGATVQTSFVYGANAEFIDFFAPGIMSFVITIITIMLTIVSIVRERTNGTMDRIFVSPTKPHEVVLGYMLAFSLISLIQSCLLLGSAILLFNMTVQGSVILALGFIILYAIGIQGLGTLLSTVARNEFQAIQLVPLVFVPFILLGGIFWPIEAMPSFIRPLSAAVPLTYAADGLRSIIIRGWGPLEVWKDLVALLIFAAVMIMASMAVTKRRARA